MPDDPHAAGGFKTPVIGGIALWGALFVAWWWRPAGIELPAIVLGLLALRLLSASGERDLKWANAAILLIDVIVCAALVQKFRGDSLHLADLLSIVAGVALLQGVYRLRSLDGLGALVLCIALAALAILATGSAHWLASTGAAAAAGLLVLNLPLRFNRSWRIQCGQGGAALLALLVSVTGLMPNANSAGPLLEPMHLIWLLPLPFCELLRFAAQRPTSHQCLLDAGFSVSAIFLLYAVTSAVPAIVLVAAPTLPPAPILAGIFASLVLLWFAVISQAPRLMWMLPWRLRRIDVVHKD